MRQVGVAVHGVGLAPYRRVLTRVRRTVDKRYLVECEDCGMLASTSIEHNAKLVKQRHMLKH
jgi:hypothetical protein